MREQFLLDPDLVFLNHGSFGACPRPVLERAQRWQLEMERNPVEFLARRSVELLEQARARLAGHVGANPADLVFVQNATSAVNTVAHSLGLAPGDEILTSDHEYGACDFTFQTACQRAGARYLRAPIALPFERRSFADRIFSRVGERTRLIFLSHITSATALIFPVAEVCARARQAGILTLIDGAHALGQIPLDLQALGADFYTANCHKWLCAPKGSAFLHARPEHHARIDALVVSWGYAAELRPESGSDFFAGKNPFERRHQWQGTRDLSAFLAVPAAIDFQAENDWGRIRQECHRLAAQTLERITARSGIPPICADADFAQMVAIPVPPMDPAALKSRLFDEHRIEVPVTTHEGRIFVRISVQAYNRQADLDALVSALGQIYGW